jgi:nucleotide-binding universal stress UspA family protein
MTTTRAGRAIRSVTAIVDVAGERRSAAVATDFARKTDAHLTGIALAYDPVLPVYTVAAPLPADFVVDAREDALSDAKDAAGAFESIAAAAGISVETRTVETNGAGGFGALVAECVLTDLVFVGQQTPEQTEPMREALIETVLFQASVPVFIVPQNGATAFNSDYALVAWDGSVTAARAVREALPLLGLAGTVTVVVVDDGKSKSLAGEPGADVAAYLARHDLDVNVRLIPNSPKGVGDALKTFAAAEKADWMVMGAYGHGRLREFILGGATRALLQSMPIPVLMAH